MCVHMSGTKTYICTAFKSQLRHSTFRVQIVTHFGENMILIVFPDRNVSDGYHEFDYH